MASGRISQAPAAAAPVIIRPLAAAKVNASPDTGAAPIPGATVDARVLVITAKGDNAAFAAIQSTLQYLGTPFDVLNASTGPALTADTLASGTHGRYNAIFLDIGDLSVGGSSAFTDAEWTRPHDLRGRVRRPSRLALHVAERLLRSRRRRRRRRPSDVADLGELHGSRQGALHRDQLRKPRRDQQGFAYPVGGARRRDDRRCSSTPAESSTPPRAATPTGARRWRSPSVRRPTTSRTSSSLTAW